MGDELLISLENSGYVRKRNSLFEFSRTEYWMQTKARNIGGIRTRGLYTTGNRESLKIEKYSQFCKKESCANDLTSRFKKRV